MKIKIATARNRCEFFLKQNWDNKAKKWGKFQDGDRGSRMVFDFGGKMSRLIDLSACVNSHQGSEFNRPNNFCI